MRSKREPYDDKSMLHQAHIALIIVGIIFMFSSSLGFFYGVRDDDNLLIKSGIIVFSIGLVLDIFTGVCIYIARKKELKKMMNKYRFIKKAKRQKKF